MADETRALIVRPDNEPDPFTDDSGNLVPAQDLPAVYKEQVTELSNTIDVDDTNSILAFGVEAQRELTASADAMLASARNTDVGPVGDTLGWVVGAG